MKINNYIEHYKTIAIEPYEVFITKEDQINPTWQRVVLDLVEQNFNVILWSKKGKEFCKQFQIDNKIRVRDKLVEKENDIYFCIDTNYSFASNFRRAGVLPKYKEGINNFEELEKIIKLYKKMIRLIENNISMQNKGSNGYEKNN